jgi:hypothetical protein
VCKTIGGVTGRHGRQDSLGVEQTGRLVKERNSVY